METLVEPAGHPRREARRGVLGTGRVMLPEVFGSWIGRLKRRAGALAADVYLWLSPLLASLALILAGIRLIRA